MPRARTPSRPDLYARVTEAILAQLEAGVRPWVQPWSVGRFAGAVSRPLRAGGQPYSGVNVLLLWSEAVARGFAAPVWMTFRQALALGGHVRSGASGATVVYANRIRRTETGAGGEAIERTIPFLKAYTVFNVEQIAELPDTCYGASAPRLDSEQRIAHAEAFFAATGAEVRQGGASAYYALEPDHVQTPPFEAFDDPEAYYATLAHECVHWTRHPSRLNRDLGRKRWGDAGYAREELVAELGAAFLCADLGLALTPRADHADYIGDWLAVLKGDTRFVFTAAAHAQRACDFLHRLQPAAPSDVTGGEAAGSGPVA